MEHIAQEIRTIVKETSELLSRMEPDEVSYKEGPNKWSKKEMLGHLIDSAANNHQRFVRASYYAAEEFPQYSQIDWVRIQQYHESEWPELVALWSAYNRHLCHVIEHLPEEAFSAPCNIGREEPVQLGFVIEDYLRHLRHHLSKLLEKT
ncbi:MAG TPA: DinB family protein [Terriglobia bacterium]|nr:DinB family protein [Terriglobia bacterium]